VRIQFAALATTSFAGYLARGCKVVESPFDTTVHDDRRTCAKESREDEQDGNADAEDWDLDDNDDSEDENDCDDSGHCSNIDGPSATPYR
jgi:hypothetical protein